MSPVFFWEQIGKIKHKYIDAILSYRLLVSNMVKSENKKTNAKQSV